MDSLRSARAAVVVVTLLFAATTAWGYDMESGSWGVPRTRNPDLIRSAEVRVESLAPTTVILGPSAAYQGTRQPKPYASPAKHAKKNKKSKKSGKRSATPDPSIQHGKVTDGDPVLAKP